MGECWRFRQLSCALPGWFIHVDGKNAEHSAGALGFERTRTETFAGPDVDIGAVRYAASTIVQLLPRRTAIAVAFGLIREPVGTEERAVLSVDTVTGSHIGRDAPIRQPLQELSVPVRRVGRYRFWLSSLPLREASEHVLRSHRFLTHPCCRRLYSHDDATVVVDQVVVVVPQPGRRAAFGRIGGIWIRGRHLVLLMHRLFGWVLLLQFDQVLAHGLLHLRRFR